MNAQSWYDLVTMPTMDPRGLIATTSFQDQAGAVQNGSFSRSTNWLQAVTWVAPPMKVSARTTNTTSVINALNAQDFESIDARQF